jgi:multidrug efflux pump
MRSAMGVAVFAGMIGVTAFGLFLTPVFYVTLRKLTGNRPLKLHGAVPHVADDDSFVSAQHPAAPHGAAHDGSSGGGGGLRPQPAAPLGTHD